MEKTTPLSRACDQLTKICRRLREPDGCAWDRAQSAASLAPYLVEEIHEVVEALGLDRRPELTDEIGDALYLWVFFLLVVEESGLASVEEAAQAIERKLIRRHPHVFGDAGAPATPQEGHGLWEQRKRLEPGREGELLKRLPAGLPALARARRLQEKAAAFGFDWSCAQEVVPKIREEVDEVAEAIELSCDSPKVAEELGDLLFAVVNLARHLGQDPEAALAVATEKFRTRFNAMSDSVERAGHRMGEAPLDLLEDHWQTVKRQASENPPPDPR
jgi:nucleoside triphosphate diphosphatase